MINCHLESAPPLFVLSTCIFTVFIVRLCHDKDCTKVRLPWPSRLGFGHKGGLLKRTDVHHRLSYNHKFFTSVHACAVQSHRLHVSPSWLGCSTIYVHYQKIKGRGKRMCAMWLCVWGIPLRVRCPVLQWKHPGLQLRWSQVRIPLPGLPEAD